MSTFLAVIVGGVVALWLAWYTKPERRIYPAGLLADRDARLARFEQERQERMAAYLIAWAKKGSLTRLQQPQSPILRKVIGSIPKAR